MPTLTGMKGKLTACPFSLRGPKSNNNLQEKWARACKAAPTYLNLVTLLVVLQRNKGKKKEG